MEEKNHKDQLLAEDKLGETIIKIHRLNYTFKERDYESLDVIAGHPSLGHFHLAFTSVENFKSFCQALEITSTEKTLEEQGRHRK